MNTPIAIVGRACLLPGAQTPEELWDAVLSGRDLISTVPADRWGLHPDDVLCDDPGNSEDRTWSDRGGYVQGFDDLFDPTGFLIPSTEIEGLDPVFQWTLHTARAALADSGRTSFGADTGERVGAVFGNLSFPSAAMAAWVQQRALGLAPGEDSVDPRNRFNSGLPALMLERALGLQSGAVALDAACASSLYAIKLACERLVDGEADVMLAGAVNSADDLCIHLGFAALQALSRSGRSRPFHAEADGLVPAEGCGFVALRRLEDALADGDPIHGVIRGVGLSNDGRGRGLLVPSAAGQARAIAAAVDAAGIAPADVSLLECHATGTQVGDATELESSASVYGTCDNLPIGSLKSNMGHLITAAGLAGLIKVVEAMRHEVRPPTLHADSPVDGVGDGSPFRLLTEAEQWDRSRTSDGVLRAGVSAFGFGGNNAHLIVEEPPSASQAISGVRSPVDHDTPLAIVGIGVTAAGAVGCNAFVDAVLSETSQLNADGQGRMPDVVLDLKRQKFPPNDLKKALAQQLAILAVADEALDQVAHVPGASTGVYTGMGTDPEAARFGVRWRLVALARDRGLDADWLNDARDRVGPPLDAPGVLGTMPNIVANRLNSQHDLAGPSFTVSSEERSGVDALRLAARALRAGEIDTALVGAVDLSCHAAHTAALSGIEPDAQKTPGDAAVMLVLKRLDDARANGDTVYAQLETVGGDRVSETADLGFDSASLVPLFGHAHAASGLLQVAAGALCLHRRQAPGSVPLLPDGPLRTASATVTAIDGLGDLQVRLVEAADSLSPATIRSDRIHLFTGDSWSEHPTDPNGPQRLAIVAGDDHQLAERLERARRHIIEGHPAGAGVHYWASPLVGDVGFVFTAAGAAYRGMGKELLRAMPELLQPVAGKVPLRTVAGWAFEPDEGHGSPTPDDYLWGSSLLCQAHAALTAGVLGLRPRAAIGYSSGETNSLHALGVWNDMGAMRGDIDASRMMTHELGVSFDAVARAWGTASADWAVWNVLAPRTDVETVIAEEERVHLAIVNTSNDVVIAGEAERCRAVVERIGPARCRPVAYNLACHVPEVAEAFHDQWVKVHTRTVTRRDDVRFYSNGVGGAYRVGSEECAAAITAQAENTVDFPATIEAAYADGVRVFIEHGPAGACSNFISEILGDREHLAIPLDRKGRSVEQMFEVAAALMAAGVEVDHEALIDRLTPPADPPTASRRLMSFPSHPHPIPDLPMPTPSPRLQMMPPAPLLPPVSSPISGPVPASAATVADAIAAQTALTTQLHRQFLADSAAIHHQFLALAQPETVSDTVSGVCADPVDASVSSAVLWGREALKIHSSGRISELFGPMFAPQDDRRIQCRMPEPPLLLADRVTGIEAEPGVLGKGTIWTETDVQPDSWYLNGGYMPAGFMIESGQADLMLISWMGIDLPGVGWNEGDVERSYRLLGCTLTYHGDLPQPGETLKYEIRITGHATHGGIRIFFFDYDCTVNGEPRLTVRDAQAGFFSADELADALGILWTPADAELAVDARIDPPAIVGTKRSFSRADLVAFSEGRAVDCFGPGFEWIHTHTRTPRIQSGPQLFIDEVTSFEPAGGPWGRGFMRCETAIADDAWFFDGHFKNDPCMPGNFMVEACIEAMSFYLAALGFTAERDGWRFQPLPGQPFELKCRGEINPQTDRVAYELHVEEIHSGPHPTIICDVLGFVDGKPSFHAHRIGVELVPGWPLSSMPELYRAQVEPVPVATDAEGFPFDWKAMISCAWGRPSEAFGSLFAPFDGTRRPPRLPGLPYHFISRITRIDGELGLCQPGMRIECEYDIPADAWYFDQNGHEVMPYAVLLEAALQPCGWVASAVGSANDADQDMLFRNLDGTGTLLGELTRTSGTLTTAVELTSVSNAGGMVIEGFDVECRLGDRVVYRMNTVFGFFPPDAFANQVGLPITDDHRRQVGSGSAADPAQWRSPSGSELLADPMLLMLDRVHHEPDAGEAGLGIVRGEKDVDITEWFFKAHFFQDPVQPGSLGIEALLQLLQFYMLDTGMAVDGMRFEPIRLDAPMTWKYRGQVTPRNELISTVMEITEVGTDEHGPFVVGNGSLWCDGLRIYEVSNMAMRARPVTVSDTVTGDLELSSVKARSVDYWRPTRGTPEGWLGDDLMDGLIDRCVNRVVVAPGALGSLEGRSALFLANHQVQIESLIVSNLLPALTGVSMTTVAHAKHRHRWIGRIMELLAAYPNATVIDQIAYFDQSQPETMAALLDSVRRRIDESAHSLFLHADGTRAQSCRTPVQRVSSVFLDFAIEMSLPIVPVRFTGGLPVDPIEGKSEFGVGFRPQDYWIGDPIEPAALAAMPLKQRIEHVVDAINTLGGPNDTEEPLPPDPAFADAVDQRARRDSVGEVFAAMAQILNDHPDPGPQTRQLLQPVTVSDTVTGVGRWIDSVRSTMFGSQPRRFIVDRATYPQLADHVVDGTVVVPAALVIEWFMRAVNELDGGPYSLNGLRVLKGITLPDFAEGGTTTFELELQPDPDGHRLTLLGADTRRPHYRAVATPAPAKRPTQPVIPVPVPVSGVAGAPVGAYEGVLFHGPAFQAITGTPLIADTGMQASLEGMLQRGWDPEGWAIDPAIVDGALQLALLWSERVHGERSLPTSIASVVNLGGPVSGPVQATLVPGRSSGPKVVCDVHIHTDDGAVVAELTGIETHALG